MKCDELIEHLTLDLARELRDDAQLRSHLATCGSCARRAERLQRIWDLAGLVPQEPVPAAAIRAVFGEIHRRRRRPRGLYLTLLRLGAVAAAAILLAVGLRSRAVRPAPGLQAQLYAEDRAGYVEPAFGTLEVEDERARGPLGLRSHSVSVELGDWVTRTEIEEIFVNASDRRLEGTFHFPLPADASISRFAMEVNGTLIEGELVERVRAREVYEGIVRKMQDPALLEWMPGNVFKARIFPIEPHSQKRVILAYTQAPRMWNGALNYSYPLVSEKTAVCPPEELSVRARLRFGTPILRLECLTHRADVARPDAHSADVRLLYHRLKPAEDFQLRVEIEPQELRVSSHKPDGEDGYLGIAFSSRAPSEALVAGTYVFVIDRSARMSEPELRITRRLVDRMIDRLETTDRVGFVAHHIEMSRKEPEFVTPAKRGAWRDYLLALRGEGASDVLGALKCAAQMAPEGSTVLYVGKGVPTWGETDGGKLAAEAASALRGRSFRAILVGSGANEESLGALAGLREGSLQRIVPGGDTAEEIAGIARTVAFRPIQELEVSAEGVRLTDRVPARCQAVYPGERVNFFARYEGGGAGRPAAVILRGRSGSDRFERRVEVTLAAGPTDQSAFMRLWAQRWLAQKTAECRSRGEPREQVDAIIAVSRKFQVMTPYTSFLVLESEEAYKQFQIERARRLDEHARAPDPKKEVKPALEDLEDRLARRLGGALKLLHEREFEAAGRELEAMDREIAAIPGAREKLSRLADEIADSLAIAKMARRTDARQTEWEAILTALKRQYESQGAVQAREADGLYQMAERWYQAGDFEKAALECEKALRLNSNHAAAKALLMEVQFILGQGKVSPEGNEYDKYMREALTRHAQTLVEIDHALQEGQLRFNSGDYGKAEREFRRILEYAKWMPAGAELESRRKAALQMLGRTQEANRATDLDLEKQRLKMIEEDKARDTHVRAASGDPRADFRLNAEQSQIEIAKHVREGERFYNARMYDEALREFENAQFKISAIPYTVDSMKGLLPGVESSMTKARNAKTIEDRRVEEEKRRVSTAEAGSGDVNVKREVTRKIARLLELSYMSFDQRKFGRCMSLCDEILAIDPHYPVARELKEDAEKSRHKEEVPQVVARKVEQWKALTDDDEQPRIPKSETTRFPSREEWAEISKRLGESVIRSEQSGKPEEDPEIVAIHRKLDTLKVDLAFDHAKLEDILSYLRDVSGLNMVLDAAVQSHVEPDRILTVKLKNLPLKDNLKLVLSEVGLDYRVTEEKVVLLTAAGRAADRKDDARPKKELVSPSQSGGGPLTGATFPLESPAGSQTSGADRSGENLVRKVDQVRELTILFGQAQMYFERGQYDRSAQAAGKMLAIEPRLAAVPELRDAAERLSHMKGSQEGPRGPFEDWRARFEQSLRESVGPELVDSTAWKQMVLKRKPKGSSEMEEEFKSEDDAVRDKLKSIRVSVDMNEAPLTAIIDYLREISGLNMHITGIENPDQEILSFKVSDVVLDGALRLMLNPRQKTYLVKSGVVLITTLDKAKKEVRLELYDVRDLTYAMKDFPGVDLSLAGARVPPAAESPSPDPGVRPATPPRAGERGRDGLSPEARTRQILEGMRLDVDMSESSPAAVLAFLRAYTGLDIVVEKDAQARLGEKGASGFKAKGLSLKDALQRFLEPRGLESWTGPDGAVQVAPRLFTGEDLVHEIRSAIGEGEWSESEGKSIQFQNGLVIVRNTEAIQGRVRELLGKLRSGGEGR